VIIQRFLFEFVEVFLRICFSFSGFGWRGWFRPHNVECGQFRGFRVIRACLGKISPSEDRSAQKEKIKRKATHGFKNPEYNVTSL
jgi:hypothetical protein